LAAINQRNLQRRRREQLERREHLERLRRHQRREHLEHLERLERLERLEHLEHLERLRPHQKNNGRGISGYIFAKRVYPKSIKEGVDYEIPPYICTVLGIVGIAGLRRKVSS
jgi:hypothetical protein